MTKAEDSWKDELSVVIPAHNEENGIGATLRELRERLPECEVVVVDDGSTDATLERALEVKGIRVVRHFYNRGYGGALKTGMRYATRPLVAWFDADNEHRIEDLSAMAVRLHQENLAAVIGRRLNPGRSMINRTGKWMLKMLARSLGVDVGRDLNCGLRIFRRQVIMRYLDLLPDAFSASMTSTMVMIERGYPFAFHDVKVKPRIGESKVRLRHGFFTFALVLRMVVLFAPLRIFVRSGLILSFLGVAYGIAVAVIMGKGLPVASLLITVTGALMIMLGLIADQISQLRLAQLTAGTSDAEELTPED